MWRKCSHRFRTRTPPLFWCAAREEHSNCRLLTAQPWQSEPQYWMYWEVEVHAAHLTMCNSLNKLYTSFTKVDLLINFLLKYCICCSYGCPCFYFSVLYLWVFSDLSSLLTSLLTSLPPCLPLSLPPSLTGGWVPLSSWYTGGRNANRRVRARGAGTTLFPWGQWTVLSNFLSHYVVFVQHCGMHHCGFPFLYFFRVLGLSVLFYCTVFVLYYTLLYFSL